MSATLRWQLDMTAVSAISHRGEHSATTTTLFRREKILQPDGSAALVPIVSGNSFRGSLRRIGEELLRDTLGYEGLLRLSAAHTLRNGGSLTKVTGEPLSGQRLHRLRQLNPQISVFGGSGGGRMIDGCLRVGKVIPHVLETDHLMVRPAVGRAVLSHFDTMALERYSRFDDSTDHDFPDVIRTGEGQADGSALMRYEIETLPAGTRFESFLRLDRATALDISFFSDIVSTFVNSGTIGGRTAIGHGLVHTTFEQSLLAGVEPQPLDWKSHLVEHRDEALAAMESLT
jgi:hypothetical protein